MGYSCTAKANYVLDAISELAAFSCDSKEYKFFLEIGRENMDGAITGVVYEKVSDYYLDTEGARRFKCKKKGAFKIGKGGEIVRFPGLKKIQKEAAQERALKKAREDRTIWL